MCHRDSLERQAGKERVYWLLACLDSMKRWRTEYVPPQEPVIGLGNHGGFKTAQLKDEFSGALAQAIHDHLQRQCSVARLCEPQDPEWISWLALAHKQLSVVDEQASMRPDLFV